MKIKNRKVEDFRRDFRFKSINEDLREIAISFSSEEPYKRWFGMEILDHKKESVDMSRMTDGAPFLLGHNHNDQIGVISSASIDDDGVGRAVVKFSKSVKASEIFQDIVDGIRTKISVGYRVIEMKLEGETDGMETYRVTKWMPFEASLVSIPADNSVGVGRELDSTLEKEKIKKLKKKEGKKMKNKKEVGKNVPGEPVDVVAVRKAAIKEEKARIRELDAISESFNMSSEMRYEAVESGISVAEFREQVMNSLERSSENAPISTAIGMSDDEVREYSLFKAINAARTGSWKDAEFELECSQKVAENLGKEARGFYVPFEVQRDAMGTAPAAGITDAGSLVATDHMGNAFVDALRAKSISGQLGVRYMTGLVGDVEIPKKTGNASFYWLAEGEDVTDSNLTIGNITMTPKTVAGSVPMTRKLLKQSDPSVEAIIRQDLVEGIALAIDAAIIAGSGASGQPKGVLTTAGVNAITVADAGNVPTFVEAVEFETAVASSDALTGTLSYLTTPAINGKLKTEKVDTGSAVMVSQNGQVNGYPIVGSSLVPATKVLYGNWEDVVVGLWGVLDISVDTAALAASGGIVLRVFQDVDVAVRNAESFAVSA